ncbi:AI-2E family transporter [Thermoactinospora rubra]|uniref:AI-2E family transporter n=1 Tax=Thermoactinospora rubra TaxID=1088767 RepID=UPI000A1185B1|nr:AI-2E family transporter [Thermoactinospora rubra]
MSVEAVPPLSRGLRVLVGVAAAVVALMGVKALSAIIGPAFLALTLTIAVSPLRSWLRPRAPAWVVALIPLLVVLLVLGGLGVSMVVAVARFAALIPTYVSQYQQLLTSIGEPLQQLGITPAQVREIIDGEQIIRFAGGLLSGLTGTVAAAVLIVLVLYGMSLDAAFFQRTLAGLAGPRTRIARALGEFARGTCRYLIVSTVFGLIVAALDVAVLAVLAVPLPLLWGLLSFITNYIPNVGFVIGLVPPAVLALLDSGVSTMIWVIAAYCVINFVIQSVIQPKFVGESAGLSTTITILSLLVWTWALGALGAILAVPLSAFVRAVLLDADPSTVWASPLVAGQGRERPDAGEP